MEPIGLIDGVWWPSTDRDCHSVIPKQMGDIDEVVSLCKGHGLAVQAGGNVGLWPKRMARQFDLVLTFEPDALNFRCLSLNVTEANVIKFQAALGQSAKMVTLDRTARNVGAHQVNEGVAPWPGFGVDTKRRAFVMTLDSLNLPSCDLIYLDVEGYETPALVGAKELIARHRPVVAFEDKGLGVRYGFDAASTRDLLASWDYVEALRLHRDVVMVPR